MERKHTSGLKVSFDPMVKNMIDSLSLLLDVKITFFTLDKEESLVGYHSNESDFCSLIQKKLNATQRCNKQDEKACLLCKKKERTIIYQCHAGLTEIMIPIKDNGLIGFAIIGQFRMHNTIPESLVSEWKSMCLDIEELKKAFLERPFYSEEKANNIARLLQGIIDLQVKSEQLRLKKPELIEQIYSYIDRNISKEITISELSKEISRSESSITHRLKASTGMSFKEIVIDKRLKRFEQIIRHDPDIALKEASASVGYPDPLYISKLYKRKRGITPTEFRLTIRSEIKKN